MKIEIVELIDNPQEECLKLIVLEDCNVGNHMIIDSTYDKNGSVSNKLRHAYFFPDIDLKKGDLVHLHTTVGKDSKQRQNNGKYIYDLYWNLKKSVWNNNEDCALLLEINDWERYKVAK